MKVSHIVGFARRLLKLFRTDPVKPRALEMANGVEWEIVPYSFVAIDWHVDVSGDRMMIRETLHLSGNAVKQSLTYRKNR